MARKDNFDGNWNFSQEIKDCINMHAKLAARHLKAIGLGGLYDVDDVSQELCIAVAEKRLQYDPERASWKTFINQIAKSTIGHIVEYHTSEQRDYTRTVPLFEDWPDDDRDDVIIRARIDYGDHPDAELLISRLPGTEDADFRLWLDDVCKDKRVKSGQAELLRWLAEDGDIQDLAEQSGIPEPTWYSRRTSLGKLFKNSLDLL